jgi:hypothetical protein
LYSDGIHLTAEGNTLIYKSLLELDIFNRKKEINP